MFIATIDTRSFSFIAAGTTIEEAKEALRAGWLAHRNEYPAKTSSNEIVEDAHILKLDPGQCARDNEVITDIQKDSRETSNQDSGVTSPCETCGEPVAVEEFCGNTRPDGSSEYLCEGCYTPDTRGHFKTPDCYPQATSLKPLTLYLTSQQNTDLAYALEGTVYQKQEQLDDIGKDYPFSDPAERDDIRNNLKRELDILEHVLSLLAGPPTRGEGPTSED